MKKKNKIIRTSIKTTTTKKSKNNNYTIEFTRIPKSYYNNSTKQLPKNSCLCLPVWNYVYIRELDFHMINVMKKKLHTQTNKQTKRLVFEIENERERERR